MTAIRKSFYVSLFFSALVLASVESPRGTELQSPTPGNGRGGGAPADQLYAQYCAGCHGPNLQGGAGSSLIDDEWKHGADDASVARVIVGGVAGTPMQPFKDVLDGSQIRQLVFFIRQQAATAKGKPELQVDPEGHIVKSERQTVKLEVVAKGLETPWGIAFLPDGRMLRSKRMDLSVICGTRSSRQFDDGDRPRQAPRQRLGGAAGDLQGAA
jgi:hypothetical protein